MTSLANGSVILESGTRDMALTDSERTDIRRFCGYPGTFNGRLVGDVLFYHERAAMFEARIADLSATELSVARRFLSALNSLENAIPRAGDNLDTDQAAIWTHNKNEIRDRLKLFDEWRRRFCQFLAIPPGPGLRAAGMILQV